jgi:hypothetical protein
LLKSLDVVIAVPTDTAHLAGALGVRTLTLLSNWPSWRWMLQGETSPWYPSMTLLRKVGFQPDRQRRMGLQPVPAAGADQQGDAARGRVENPSHIDGQVENLPHSSGWNAVFREAAGRLCSVIRENSVEHQIPNSHEFGYQQQAAECLAPATRGIALPANPLPRR